MCTAAASFVGHWPGRVNQPLQERPRTQEVGQCWPSRHRLTPFVYNNVRLSPSRIRSPSNSVLYNAPQTNIYHTSLLVYHYTVFTRQPSLFILSICSHYATQSYRRATVARQHHIMKVARLLACVALATSATNAASIPEVKALDAHPGAVVEARNEILAPENTLEKRKGGGGGGGGGGGRGGGGGGGGGGKNLRVLRPQVHH